MIVVEGGQQVSGNEDQRSAANLYASLSSYVMTASLGVIAAQVALATFVLEKRENLASFLVLLIFGILASVASIVIGGKGIHAIISSGFRGSWSLKISSNYFNAQAILCLLGMACLLVSWFTGTPKAEGPTAIEQIQRLNLSVERLEKKVQDLQSECVKSSDETKPSKESRPTPKSSSKNPKTTQ